MPLNHRKSGCLSAVTGTRIKEASVKNLKCSFLALLVLSLLAIPAAAQQGKDRDNKGGADTGVTGPARADLVKGTNKTPNKNKDKKDKDPDNDKNDSKGRRKGYANGHHTGRH